MRESWVETTRREAVTAQIKAAAIAAVVMVERNIVTETPYDGDWGAAERSMLRRLAREAKTAHTIARHAADRYHQALASEASEAAMPRSLRAVS